MQEAAVMGRAAGENFPVASRVLPRRVRGHLLALYGFARLVDEVGDGALISSGVRSNVGASQSDRSGMARAGTSDAWTGAVTTVTTAIPEARLKALDELEDDLDRAYRGEAEHPLLKRLEPTLRECGLPREPLVRLIEANRVDQRVSRYASWEQLRGYCELSANPVGELVLGVFGAATPERVMGSDAICTALQVVEHCQDVAEDWRRGRVYLPEEDMRRFGATEADLAAARASEPLRRTIGFEIARARELFREGMGLIGELDGVRERLAVAAFIAGGRAACDAIERAGCDVLPGPSRAGAGRRLLAWTATLWESRAFWRRGLLRLGQGTARFPGARGPGTLKTPRDTKAAKVLSTSGATEAQRVSVGRAYRYCEAVTRAKAANFYYGIRLLTSERRKAMCAVYAFARRVDDIGDGDMTSEEKLKGLDEQARALAGLPGGAARSPSQTTAVPSEVTTARSQVATARSEVTTARSQVATARSEVATARSQVATATSQDLGPAAANNCDPVMVALADAYKRFAVPPDALQALIAGVRMDVEGVEYETFDELVVYCRHVAGAIGRACLAIFGLRDPDRTDQAEAYRLADDLGVALQITNVLRDVSEDARNGRVYLPAEDLRRFEVRIPRPIAGPEVGASRSGVEGRPGDGGPGSGVEGRPGGGAIWGEHETAQMAKLMRFEAGRAREWFDRSIVLAKLLDRRSAACVLAMAGIYSRLLDRIAADPERALQERVSLPVHEKAWVAARSMAGAGA